MTKSLPFLLYGGEKGALICLNKRESSTVGLPGIWPQNLLAKPGILFISKYPMFLPWEKDLICFYSDAYQPSLGNSCKHLCIPVIKEKRSQA